MIAGWVPIPIETLGWLGGLEYLLGYGKKTMLLSFQSLDIPRRFCHRIAMTSLPIAGVGMIPAHSDRGRPGCAEKRFLVNGMHHVLVCEFVSYLDISTVE